MGVCVWVCVFITAVPITVCVFNGVLLKECGCFLVCVRVNVFTSVCMWVCARHRSEKFILCRKCVRQRKRYLRACACVAICVQICVILRRRSERQR